MSRALLERQAETYDAPIGFADKWARARRFFESDLETGYVRLFMELAGLGISHPAVGAEVRRIQGQWLALLRRVAGEAGAHFGITGVSGEDVATYVRCFWLGMGLEMMLGIPETEARHWQSLWAFERFLRWIEAERQAGRSPVIT